MQNFVAMTATEQTKLLNKKTVIRVLDIRQITTDILNLGEEGLRNLLEQIPQSITPQNNRNGFYNSINHFAVLADDYKRCQSKTPYIDSPPEIALRQLLYNDSLYPVVSNTGRKTTKEFAKEPSILRVRAGVRKEAFTIRGELISFAAEEPIDILGVVLSPAKVSSPLQQKNYLTDMSHQMRLNEMVQGGWYRFLDLVLASNKIRKRLMGPISQPLRDALHLPQELLAEGWTELKRLDTAHQVVKFPNSLQETTEVIRLLSHRYLRIFAYLEGENSIWLGRWFATHHAEKYMSHMIESLQKNNPDNSLTAAMDYTGDSYNITDTTTIRTVDPDHVIDLISKLSEVYPISKSPGPFRLPILYDLFRTGTMHILKLLMQDDGDSIAIALQRAGRIQNEQIIRQKTRKELSKDIGRARQYMIILEDKLGAERLAKVKHLTELHGVSDDPSHLLEAISDTANTKNAGKRDTEVVQTEYDNRKREIEMQVKNTCPHVALLLKLRAIKSSDEGMAILQKLRKFYKRYEFDGNQVRRKNKETSTNNVRGKFAWILCENCGFRVICPHVDTLIHMRGQNSPYDEIQDFLAKYAGNRQFTGSESYCKICSERLSDITYEERSSDVRVAGDMDSGLRRLIWIEALKASDDIRFSVPTDPRNFASTAVEVCYPLIVSAEKTISRKGGRQLTERADELDSVDPRTHLYVIIFIYAYILNLVRGSNQQNSAGGGPIKIDFEGVAPNSKTSEYVNRIMETIAHKNSSLINKIENITNEFIISRFREAYRLVIAMYGGQALSGQEIAKTLLTEIVELDPIYHYAKKVAKVTGHLPLYPARLPEEAHKEFASIMGDTLPTLMSSRPPPMFLNALMGKKAVFEIPRGVDAEYVYKDPDANLYTKIFNPEKGKNIPTGREISDLMNLPASSGGPIKTTGGWDTRLGGGRPFGKYDRAIYIQSYRLFVEYTTRVTSHETWEIFRTHFNEFLVSEAVYKQKHVHFAQPALYTFFDPLSRRPDQRTRQYNQAVHGHNITLLYDENGLRHQWSQYVYTDQQDHHLIFTRQQLHDKLFSGKDNVIMLDDYVLTDLQCSVCGILKSKVSKLDPAKVLQSLRVLTEFGAFFTYYESRCPIGGLHSFDGEVCTKCSLDLKLIQDHCSETALARKYYNKFYTNYREDRRRAVIPEIPTKTSRQTSQEGGPRELLAKNWVYDYGQILKTSQLLHHKGVTPSVIENIGATEKRSYADIRDGKGDPPMPEDRDHPRILAADSVMRLFTTYYNMLRNYPRLQHPPLILSNLMKTTPPPDALSEFAILFPDISCDYSIKLSYMQKHRSPADTLHFIIESFCVSVNTVHGFAKDGVPWYQELSQRFAIAVLEDVLLSEKLLSKPGPFNFMIFGDENVSSVNDSSGDNIEAYSGPGDVAEEVSEEYDPLADREENNPFSLEYVDISAENLDPN